jgi:hypothetical protein
MKKIYFTSIISILSVFTSIAQNSFPANQDPVIAPGYSLRVLSGSSSNVGVRLFGSPGGWVTNAGAGFMQMFGSFIYDDGGVADGVGGLHFANGANQVSIHSGAPGSPTGIRLNAFGGTSYFSYGKFGIGTAAPVSHFQLATAPYNLSFGEAEGPNLYYGTSYLGFNAARGDDKNWTVGHDGFNNGGGVIYSNIFGDIFFAPIRTTTTNSTSNTPQILSDAAIKSKIALSVRADGVTRAKSIIVETVNWPDYVFRSSYQLADLQKVNAFIQANHHLPDMPSARVIEKEGINVSEMNKILTRKVEELTLYLIEKDKQLKAQTDENKKQNLRIRRIEARLRSL